MPTSNAAGAAIAAGAAATDDDGAFERVDGLLDDCIAARLPELRLSWHYRSKHEDLIAFANQRIYGDQLQVLPIAQPSPDLGIAWRKVEGTFDVAARTNRREAEAIVAEVLARLADPGQRTRSVGIVTFSHAQQHLVADLLDEACAKDPALAASLEARDGEGIAERLFVKQVEAVQGDERDVVLISVGYARGDDGALPASFGPLSLPDAERRLAIATTRAREQLVVVSSIAPEDLADATAPGVRELAALLELARAGGGTARPTDDTPPATPITAAIARALAERGWVLRHQVGCGAYKIDLAVVDPNDSERYVLAIEHDGPAYASTAATRDRDRLRPQVLAQLGWRLHRIWSLDWWLDPEREVQRAHSAIVTAVAASRRRSTASGPVRAERTGRGIPARAGRTDSAATRSRPDSVARVDDAGPTAGAATGRATRGATGGPTGVSTGEPTGVSTGAAAGGSTGASIGGSIGAAAGGSTSVSTGGATAAAGGSTGAATGAATGAEASTNSGRTRTARGTEAPALRVQPQHGSGAIAAGSGPTDAITALVAAGEGSGPQATGSAPIRIARNTIQIGPYMAAAIPAGRRAPDDLFAPRHVGELEKIVEQVLAAEAPMHIDVLARRVGAYFGIGRLTQRVVDQVKTALAGRGRWGDEDNIVWRLDQDPAGVPAVRVAGQNASARRDIDEVPLLEVAAAARIVVERASGIAAKDLVRDAARLLGFARTTDKVIERVASGVRLAVQRELIRLDEGKATLLE